MIEFKNSDKSVHKGKIWSFCNTNRKLTGSCNQDNKTHAILLFNLFFSLQVVERLFCFVSLSQIFPAGKEAGNLGRPQAQKLLVNVENYMSYLML